METSSGRTAESQNASAQRRRSRPRAASPTVPVPADFAASARPALYRIDTTPEPRRGDESLVPFADQERRRTLQTIARLAGGDLRTSLRRTSLVGMMESLRRSFVPYALSRRIALSIASPESSATCLASGEVLEATTRALLWNALECVPSGAVVRVAASIDASARTAKIELRDNGPLLAPGEWESLRNRLDQVAKPSDLFGLARPEFALARQLATLGGLSVERRERPATNVVEIAASLRPDARALTNLSRRAAASGARALSIFSLRLGDYPSKGATTVDEHAYGSIDEIAYGSLPNGSLLWRTELGAWLAVAPLSPLDWCDWLRRFHAALHLERIRTDRAIAPPAWTFHGAWPAGEGAESFASAVEELLRGDLPSAPIPAATIPLQASSRVDEAHDALRLLGYRRFRQESSEWGEVRIVAERD